MSDEDYYLQRQRREQAERDRLAGDHRPDGTALRTLRVITYMVVICTCIIAVVTLFEFHLWLTDMREAVRVFVDGFTTEGILGN